MVMRALTSNRPVSASRQTGQKTSQHARHVALASHVKLRTWISQPIGYHLVMGELSFKFNPEKAGQATVYLLKLSGGKHTKGHLDKMLYAADWSQLRRFGVSLTGDKPVSMPQGPVLSDVLHLLTGEMKHPFWEKHISKAPKGASLIHLLANSPTDLLTESEKETLGKVHAHMAALSWDDLKKFCYKFFTEWKDPKGSQNPIDFEDMLLKSGKKKPEFVEDLVSIQRERDFLSKAFAG
jgi:hypothetical protein